jgi:hypothetical protein
VTGGALLIHLELNWHLAASRRCAERDIEQRLHVLTALRSRRTASTTRATATKDRPKEIAEAAEAADVEILKVDVRIPACLTRP